MLILLLSVIYYVFAMEAGDGYKLVVSQTLSSNGTLVSRCGTFERGFFKPGSSSKEYVGIWNRLSSKRTVFWVANRELPVVKTPGKLTLRENGTLEIMDSENVTIWSSNSKEAVLNPEAQLLDSGNFVVRDKFSKSLDAFLWQGFDYPCDTRVPGMKIGYDKRKKHNVYLSSWKSLDDPAEGEYSFKIDIIGIPQYFLRKGYREKFRTGPWNGHTFSGTPMKSTLYYNFSYISDDEWIYFILEPLDPTPSRTVLHVNGDWLLLLGNEDNLAMNMTYYFATKNCDKYNWCGTYSSCNSSKSTICECLIGYVPKSQKDWDMKDWSKGCIRKNSANCSIEDMFYKLSSIKVPDTRNAYGNMSLSLAECRIACLENCSCTAYGNWNVLNGGTGCLLWFGELKDIKVYDENGQDIFVRGHKLNTESNVKVIIISSSASALVLVGIVTLIICHRRRIKLQQQQRGTKDEIATNSGDLNLPLFDTETLSKATDNFSIKNKLGEGGFGPVYMGLLAGGQKIAVKKLSQNSKQGSVEFKNEVMCIAKLQHRNLVKLLGCCIQEEYMLIYEFMPNKSLDLYIFNDKERTLLDWPKRLNIINGIARGLLYLHQDSCLIIIHRDLKASNVLLDIDMNPKISDFGMARICGGSEITANTTRVVGTYGYMSPEYAIEGRFSVKSDVFSFGVIVLEIVSGKRNKGFNHPDHHLNLLGHTWELFKQGRFGEAVDSTLTESYDPAEVIRAIHVGLLCVQERSDDRPNMAGVVSMLSSEAKLPSPNAPGFFRMMKSVEHSSSSSDHHLFSANKMSVTVMDPR